MGSKLRRGARTVALLAIAVATVATTTTATATATPSAAAATSAREHLAVTDHGCAETWAAPIAGHDAFVVANRSSRPAAVYLYNPYTGVTVARHTALAPHADATLRIDLKPGSYAWSCYLHGASPMHSKTVTVVPRPVMTAAGPATAIPVPPAQLAGAVAAYRGFISGALAQLGSQVSSLRAAIATGQLDQAESAWLTAHLTWQRMGAAYDAFGTLGDEINGLAPGKDVGQTPGTPTTTSFQGFHKIEQDLWEHQDLAAATADAAQLATNVATLAARFPHESIPAAELPLRTHEILEDALRDELSGADDYGSGTDMASVQADVSGTELLLHLLTPLIDERAPDLVSRATAQLDRLDQALAATRDSGRWVAVADVPLAQRQQVDGAIGAALEILAIVPDILPVEGSTL